MQGDQFSILFIYKINERERKVVKFEFPFRLVSVSSYVFFFLVVVLWKKKWFPILLIKVIEMAILWFWLFFLFFLFHSTV